MSPIDPNPNDPNPNDPKANERFERAFKTLSQLYGADDANEMIRRAQASPVPEHLLGAFARLAPHGSPVRLEPLARLLEASDFVVRPLASQPATLRWLARPLPERTPAFLFHAARRAVRRVRPLERRPLSHFEAMVAFDLR